MSKDGYQNGYHAIMYGVWELLDKVDLDQHSFSLTGYKLGKLIRRYKLKSKYTITHEERMYYHNKLVEVYKNWAIDGHPDWNVKEKEMQPTFTVEFIRKEGI